MLQDLLEEEWKAFAHHGITPYKSEPVSPCSQGIPSDDAVKVNGSDMTSKLDIIQFGWEVKGVIPSPCIDTDLPVPHGLTDVINYLCKAEGKACNIESCSCHKHNMSCIV